jgi:hypothetical protein
MSSLGLQAMKAKNNSKKLAIHSKGGLQVQDSPLIVVLRDESLPFRKDLDRLSAVQSRPLRRGGHIFRVCRFFGRRP